MANIAGLFVEKAGLLDTIQDQGRMGFQSYGMVVSGAMDPYAYQLGNLLLGNDKNDCSLEITLTGPQLRFTAPTAICLTGANLSPTINGKPIEMWKCVMVNTDELLSFGRRISGCRVYLAIKGGFLVSPVMGSSSTYIKGQLGGIKGEGRALQRGDVIPYQIVDSCKTFSLRPDLIPIYQDHFQVRVVLGPQDHAFTEQGLYTFLRESYQVSPQMDRMGLRLHGKAIEHRDVADIFSDSIPLGGIQVPADGQPIILMAERQTTGGYTKIATVISVDLPKIAQAVPNQQISFSAVSIEEAHALYRQQHRLFRTLELCN